MNNKIAILVSCHKPSKTIKNKFITPIQVGCDLTQKRLGDCFYDNDGENISKKNKRYCELTAQYYAWKNIHADYYGFFHYRRYLSFSKKPLPRMIFNDAKIEKIDEKTVERLALSEKEIEDFVEKYDMIVPKRIFSFYNRFAYKVAKFQHIRDLDFCIDIIKKDYPEIYPYAKNYMNSGFAYYCNMFVMKKDIFNSYCKWLFDILEKHEKEYPCEDYNVQEYRVSGFLAERLLGVYVTYLMANKNLKIKRVQKVKIKDTNIK